jgi:hypothetical protein
VKPLRFPNPTGDRINVAKQQKQQHIERTALRARRHASPEKTKRAATVAALPTPSSIERPQSLPLKSAQADCVPL